MEQVRKALNNGYFARTMGDKLASCAFVLGGIFTMWYELLIVFPYYNKSWSSLAGLHVVIAMWTYTGAMTNWYKMIATRTFGYYTELQSKQNSNWKYCDTCFAFCPPRTHHCRICNICVAKRDHHCWFAGCCIGHKNQRYYLMMCIYIWIAAVYSNIYNYVFVMDVLGGFGVGTVFLILFPHGAALLGFVTFYQFCVAVVSCAGFICLIMFSWLLQIQIAQLKYGQTKYERKYGITEYNLGFVNNLIEVLGEKWYLTWISAWLISEMPADGTVFNKLAKDL